MLCFFSLLLAYILPLSLAYIPAQPANGTDTIGTSRVYLKWFAGGVFSENISYQLVGQGSQGVSQGALVHFSEALANETTPPTSTPWIALVSCDANSTNASQQLDIFTLASDLGAVSALLYSVHSDRCVINPEYANPAVFNQVFDIFTVELVSVSQAIEDDFKVLNNQGGVVNGSAYYWYNSQTLNNSATVITQSIATQNPPSQPGYLIAALVAANATNASAYASATSSGDNTSSPPSSKSNTALAMIVLYAITGCVSALFCLVVVSGAIRAIRHPERYGPRSGQHGPGVPQTRAQGLTRAILDTFPIVKFGSPSPPPNNADAEVGMKDSEDPESPHQSEFDVKEVDTSGPITAENRRATVHFDDDQKGEEPSTSTSSPPSPAPRPEKQSVTVDGNEVMPASIGRETCPICIMDFEEGDDLRQLPCEGQHRFHQRCVDPWLLELSSSCPICRHDFLALETLLSADSESDFHYYSVTTPHTSSRTNRFSRYVRQAIRRRREREEQDDPTNPPMPLAPDV